MSNSRWMEGVVANTCAERPNVPGYGIGAYRQWGRNGAGRECMNPADLGHSNAGWNTIARHARNLHMEDDVCRSLPPQSSCGRCILTA